MRELALELYQRKKPWLIVIGLLLLLNIMAMVGIAFFQQPVLEHKKEIVTERQRGLDAMAHGDASSDVS